MARCERAATDFGLEANGEGVSNAASAAAGFGIADMAAVAASAAACAEGTFSGRCGNCAIAAAVVQIGDGAGAKVSRGTWSMRD